MLNKFNKKYLIICPRTNSFGGVFEMFVGVKFATVLKKKIVLAVPFINIHPKHKKKKIFAIYLIKFIFKRLDFLSQVISFFLTIYLNFNLILYKLKIIRLIDIIFFKMEKKINKYFPHYFGFYFPNQFLNNYYKNKNYFSSTDILNWKKIKDLKNENYLPKISKEKKRIIVFIKDINYHNQVAQGSYLSTADIESYRESFNLLLVNNFTIERAGDSTQTNFSFSHRNFSDSTQKNYSQKKQYLSYLKSEIYFGNGGSTLSVAGSFNKPRVISNATWEYLWHPTEFFTKKDIIIFKKIYSKKHKKILSFEEIFCLDLQDIKIKNNFILIENTKDEILKLTKVFIDLYQNNNYENFSISTEFNNLLHKFNKKNFNNSVNFQIYDINEYMLPNFFLEKYLYPNKYLDEESSKFEILIKKNI